MMTRENKKNNNNTQITQVYIHTHSTKEKSKSRRYGTKYVFIQMLNSMKPVVSYERHSQIKVTMWKGGDVVCERRERSIADPNDRKKKKKTTQAPHRHARYRQRHLLTGKKKINK